MIKILCSGDKLYLCQELLMGHLGVIDGQVSPFLQKMIGDVECRWPLTPWYLQYFS